MVNGKCTAIYPHARLRVNTAFEVVRSAGKETAYADKHPAYDLVRGPSGKGLSVGYFPEIASVANDVNATIRYDQLHVNAFLAWLDGSTPTNSEGSLGGTVPTLFGGNFQAVSVAQKTVGYNPDGSFSAPLLQALDFVDKSLGAVVDKLKTKGYWEETLVIVASKHGQAPIDKARLHKIDPDAVVNTTGVPVAFATTDDIALLFLNRSSDTATAVANLNAHRDQLGIDRVISGDELIKRGFGDPKRDPAVPDIIVKVQVGVIYTTSKSKIAEHGGLSEQDRHVACFVSSAGLEKRKVDRRVSTRSVAPTVLRALGLDPKALEGVKAEGTPVLDGF